MNEINPSKYKKIINRSNKRSCDSNLSKNLINLSLKSLVVIIVLIFLAIIYKSDNILKDNISSYFFEDNISFAQINKIYDKYLGGILPIKKTEDTTEVFNEKFQILLSIPKLIANLLL